jgi:hypothetical protein
VATHLQSVDVDRGLGLGFERGVAPEPVEVRSGEGVDRVGVRIGLRGQVERVTWRKERGLPDASARASAVLTTS